MNTYELRVSIKPDKARLNLQIPNVITSAKAQLPIARVKGCKKKITTELLLLLQGLYDDDEMLQERWLQFIKQTPSPLLSKFYAHACVHL